MAWDSLVLIWRRLVDLGNAVTVVDSLIPEYGGNLRNLSDLKEKITINLSDTRDTYSLREIVKDKDYLFNLAGQTSHLDSMENPFTDLDINAKAQLSILEACRKIIQIFELSLQVLDKFTASQSTYQLMKITLDTLSM